MDTPMKVSSKKTLTFLKFILQTAAYTAILLLLAGIGPFESINHKTMEVFDDRQGLYYEEKSN